MNSVMCIKTSYSAHPWFCKGSGKEGSKEVYSCWKFLQVLLRPTCDWGRGVFLWFFLNPLTECILLWQAPRPIGQSCLRPTGASSEPKGSGSSTTETAGQTGGTMKRAGRECHLLSHPPPSLSPAITDNTAHGRCCLFTRCIGLMTMTWYFSSHDYHLALKW